MAAPPTKERVLQLLGNVELRIFASANKEEKLNELLQKYLAPILVEAGSEYPEVKAKVVQIFHKLKTFIQPPKVILPVRTLLDQYKSKDSSLVKKLDILGIQHSLERIGDDERRALIPEALKGIAQEEGQAQAKDMCHIILRLLLDIQIPPRGSKEDMLFRQSIGLSNEADAQYLANLIGLFLRLRAPVQTQTWPEANPTFSKVDINLLQIDGHESKTIFRRMSELKRKLVTLLGTGAFTNDEKFLPALYATANFDSKVASTASEILKRTFVSMEAEPLIDRLFQAHSSLPAGYRTQILGVLAKSTISTSMSENIMAVVNLDFAPSESVNSSNQHLQPLSALERTKLHTALFQYLSWVASVGPSREGFTVSAPLISKMRSYVETQGWPRPESTTSEDTSLRSKAYETIGVLTRSANMTLNERLHLASWLFQSLSEDPTNEAVVSIDSALSSLAASIPITTGHDADLLKTLLLKFMKLPDEAPAVRSTRHAVVKWANQCLKFSDITGRWIDILAIGGREHERNDVVEQGEKGLDPWTYFAHIDTNVSTSPPLPDWRDMVVKFIGSPISHTTHSSPPSLSTLSEDVFKSFIGTGPKTPVVALRYIKNMMFLAALDDFKVEPDWQQTLSARVNTDNKTRECIRAYLRTVDHRYIELYLNASFRCATDSEASEEYLRCFVAVASLSPLQVVGVVAKAIRDPHFFMEFNKKEVRSLGASAAGILAPHTLREKEIVLKEIEYMMSQVQSPEIIAAGSNIHAEGILLSFGHVLSRCVYYGRNIPDEVPYPLGLLAKGTSASPLYDVTLDSFAQLWTAGLATPPHKGDQCLQVVVQSLAAEARKGNEKAIFALGRLASSLEEAEADQTSPRNSDDWSHGSVGPIMQELFALHTLKRIEVQFTVGEAITAAVARWDSDYMKVTVDVDSQAAYLQKGARTSALTALLNKLFADCKTTKPSLLKASGIWLFCIVQYCSHVNEVQSRLREAQAAFMHLLSARDELVQETASRGLSLVYERGDPLLRSTLVKDLVSAFTGSGPQLKVDQETELFEPGALPTGEGNSITSYKDIVSLANEVGDQRLVYKFMSLATNAATWSTRSAFGRFGLSTILSDSDIDPKLWPKLYRYRFDPNTNVRRSMEHIWKALAKDSNAVIDTHFDAILQDLLKSIIGREWRIREASCAALADLIHGRPFPQYEKLYGEIWTAALKVLDDVKGSVREAAMRLCMTLSKGLVRQLEEGNGSAPHAVMMKEALHFLLSDKGVESSVQEIQIFALSTVIDITKKGGRSLRPFMPTMVPQLLGLLSSMEPQVINYQYQRLGEDSRDQIDKLRSMVVNQSPLSEAIENCLRFIDKDTMAKLAPNLMKSIKTAIGLPTKLGCARLLGTLFTRHYADAEPFQKEFLNLMVKQTMDKNDEVSRAYADATAYCIRGASMDQGEWFCDTFIKLYLGAEEESRRQKVADVISSLGKLSSDKFGELQTKLLAFSYLGSHDTDEYTRKRFEQVWSEHAGTSRTVVRYVKEICHLVECALETKRWALRDAGAFTVAAMVKDVVQASDTSGHVSDGDFATIWPVLDRVLTLKTFPGKEKLLEVFPDFIEKSRPSWELNSTIAARMKVVALREARRNNQGYRVHAYRALWRFSRLRNDLDLLDDIVDIVTPRLDEFKDEDKMEVDSEDDLAEEVASSGLEAIARGYSPSKIKEDSLAVLGKILDLLKPYLSSPRFATIKRQVWYKCLHDLMEDALSPSAAATDDKGIAITYLLSLDLDLVDVGTESQRVMRAKAAGALLKAKARGVFGRSGPSLEQFKKVVGEALAAERSLDVLKVLKDILAELE